MKIIGKHKALIDWAEKEVRASIQTARELGTSKEDIKELENQLSIEPLKFETRLVRGMFGVGVFFPEKHLCL